MTAQKAKSLAEKALDISRQKEIEVLDAIYAKIEEEAGKGHYFVNIYKPLSAFQEKEIKNMGFKLPTASHARNEFMQEIRWD